MFADKLKYTFAFLVFIFSHIVLTAQNKSTFDSLSKELINSKESVEKIDILLALSAESIGNNSEQAAKYAEEAYQIANSQNYNKEAVKSLLQMGMSFIRTNNYGRAFESAEKAIELASYKNMNGDIAQAKALMAIVYYELGDYEKSAKYDFENLKYYEEVNDLKQIGIVLGNIGIDFCKQNNYQKGLEYLQKSFDIAMKNNDLHGVAYQYNNIASVYTEYYNDFRMALVYYNEALKINSKLGDKRQEGIYLMNIGNCYSKLLENDSALMYYQQANTIFKEISNSNLYAECQILLGEYYLSNNSLSQSLPAADTAFKISEQNDNIVNIKAVAGLLHRIYLSKKDTIRAYHYAMIENQAKDTLVEMQNQQEVYKLEFQYNLEKNDKVKQIARQKKEEFMLIIILSLVSGLIIVILLFSRHRIKTKNVALKNEAMEKELQFKNKELTINLLSLIKKNEMLSDISNKLTEIGRGAKREETKDAIARIAREIRKSSDDKMLKEFSLRFQEVHVGFYDNLLKQFPDLSANELKLCALLRLNMSSKDISEITGQRIQTIDHARYRLRKKLSISNSDINLVAYLAKF
jgi:tetratricopeptide (TPR) repeat protein